MKKSKKLWVALACAFTFFSHSTAFAIDKLVFELSDGTKITFAISDCPTFTFSGDSLIASDKNGTKKTIALAQVKNYSIENVTNAIEQTTATTEKPTFVDGHVYYEGLPKATIVRIIATNGQEMARYISPANGKLDIDLTTLTKGVYIIQAGKNSIKITY